MTESFVNNPEPSYNNLDYLKDLLGNDRNAIKEILAEIKSQWADDDRELKDAVHIKSIDEIKRLLHRVKSTFSPLGPDHILYRAVIDKEESVLKNQESEAMDETLWNQWICNLETEVDQLSADGF